MKNSGPPGHQDGLETIILFLVVSIVAAIGLWFFAGDALTRALITLRRAEMLPFTLISADAEGIHDFLGRVRLLKVQWNDAYKIAEVTGQYVRWLYVLPLAAMGIHLFLRAPRNLWGRQHSMKSLAKVMAKMFPVISPTVPIMDELVKGDIMKGPWAVSQTEWEFVRAHGLVDTDSKGRQLLNRAKTKEVLAKQLGPRWTGVKHLPPHAKALFAIFAMRIEGDKAARIRSAMRINDLAAQFNQRGGGFADVDLSWVDGELSKFGSGKTVQRILGQHAYERTVLATMLQAARRWGVLASADFVWLRPTDRELWFTISSVGRYAFVVEACGICAHWLYEKTTSMSIVEPQVDKAIDGIELALTQYLGDEDEDINRFFK